MKPIAAGKKNKPSRTFFSSECDLQSCSGCFFRLEPEVFVAAGLVRVHKHRAILSAPSSFRGLLSIGGINELTRLLPQLAPGIEPGYRPTGFLYDGCEGGISLEPLDQLALMSAWARILGKSAFPRG